MSELSDYELSRAYAEGWNAARKNIGDALQAARNPHPEGEAHKRWADGYNGAMESRNSGKMNKR